MSELPAFRFYPGCYADEMFRASTRACAVCGQARGWEYVGATYGRDPPKNPCPWCIADGSAAKLADCEFGAFNDVGETDEALRDEVASRTPKPLSWQDFTWPVSNQGPMIYEGRIDFATVKNDPPRLAALRAAVSDEKTMSDFVSKDGDINVLMFRSLDGAMFIGVFDAS